jgi:histidine kinase-like protein
MKLPEPQLPTELAHEIYYIVHEALVNAARHACASTVCAEIELQNDHVRITVADNGRGFPFRGRYTLAALMSLQLGPGDAQGPDCVARRDLGLGFDGDWIVPGHLLAACVR